MGIFFFRVSSFHTVNVEFCSRGLASGPTSKRLASDGGLLVCSGQLLMM